MDIKSKFPLGSNITLKGSELTFAERKQIPFKLGEKYLSLLYEKSTGNGPFSGIAILDINKIEFLYCGIVARYDSKKNDTIMLNILTERGMTEKARCIILVLYELIAQKYFIFDLWKAFMDVYNEQNALPYQSDLSDQLKVAEFNNIEFEIKPHNYRLGTNYKEEKLSEYYAPDLSFWFKENEEKRSKKKSIFKKIWGKLN